MDIVDNLGVNSPEIFAAQWALEYDWGESVTGKYNYWRVKAGNGDPNNNSTGTIAWTTENINGKEISVQQEFKDYNSLRDAIQHRLNFTNNTKGRYDAYNNAKTAAEATDTLQNG